MSDDLYNQPARASRMLFIIGSVPILIGLFAEIFLHAAARHLSPGMQALQVLLLMAFPLGGALMLSGLMTLPAARRASRILDEFRAGQYLARWSYDQTYWDSFIKKERRRLSNTAWVFVALVGGTGAIVTAIMACVSWGGIRDKLVAVTVALGCTLILAIAVFKAVTTYALIRCRRLQACGETIIGSRAAYMGGDLAFWDYGIRALRGIRYVAGDSPKLELAIGFSPRAKKFMLGFDLLSLLVLTPSNSSQFLELLVIPVPRGQETNARAVFDRLVEFIPKKNRPQLPVPQASASSAPAPTDTHEPAVPLDQIHHNARHWWRVSAGIGLTGISLFIAAVIGNAKEDHTRSELADSFATAGFFVFLIGLLLLPIAIYKSLRFWRISHRVHAVRAKEPG